ncbi:transposase family protein [Legionella sp. CNM-4043-24]|uniref:transposase family protein n=1 Tax=Legionella sp. CNM-4043-24 TaxID=3421646 RepID=UPI00403AFBAA
MNKDVSSSFESHFGVLNDPRIERSKLYPLSEILFVVLSGSICGAESWRDYVLLRTKYLESCGYRVLRIWNHEVFKNIQGVMDGILNLLETVPHPPPSSPALLPQGRREQSVSTD